MRATSHSRTARFYNELGLEAKEHTDHGPTHFELLPLSESMVVEIYQASANFPGDAVMIEVESLEDALEVARRSEISPRSEIKELKDSRFVYIKDPDGRDVMLIQKIPAPI